MKKLATLALVAGLLPLFGAACTPQQIQAVIAHSHTGGTAPGCRDTGTRVCPGDKNVQIRLPNGSVLYTDAANAIWLIEHDGAVWMSSETP